MFKKVLSVLLAGLLCLSLAACTDTGQQENTTADSGGLAVGPMAGSAETEQEPAAYRLDSYTVADEQRSDDGRLLASCEYQIPQLTALHADGTAYDPASEGNTAAVKVMENVNQYFTDWLTEEQKWFDEMTQMAREDYTLNGDVAQRWSADDSFYYSDTMAFTSWQNEALLCITMETYGYTGGVHGYASKSAVTFELYTGTVVHASDLATNFSQLDSVVSGEILNQIEQRRAQDDQLFFFDDYADAVKEWTERAVSVDDTGLTVTFPAYDLAPYAMGEQAFFIPYTLIRPYLSTEAAAMLGLAE